MALLDNDREGHIVKKLLLEKLLVDQRQIVFAPPTDPGSIEDLFTHDDFDQFVLAPADITRKRGGKTNSQLVRDSNKPLLARQFFDSVSTAPKKVKLSAETLSNFKDLLTTLNDALTPE